MRFRGLLAIICLVLPCSAAAAEIHGQILVKFARDNSNAVVYIDKIPGKRFMPPSGSVKLDQVNLTFTPHVLAVLAGTNIEFPNSDEIRHNVFSPGPHGFNLGTYPQHETRFKVFSTPGVVTLLCNIHAEMSAYVVVTETPYFQVTDKDGKFTLKDVPAGTYTIRVWHEKTKKQAAVVVQVGDTPTVNLPPIEIKR